MEKSNFALRLLPSLLKAAQRIAEAENCSVNQLINVALAEKLAILDEERWKQRANSALGNPRTRNVMDAFKGSERPRKGDEILPGETKTRKGTRVKSLTIGG